MCEQCWGNGVRHELTNFSISYIPCDCMTKEERKAKRQAEAEAFERRLDLANRLFVMRHLQAEVDAYEKG